MMQASVKSSIDFKFRVYLLELCDGRELTSNDIWRTIIMDYTDKKFTRQRIDGLLKQFVGSGYHLLSRNKIEPSEGDRCRYSYTTTKRGRERAKYYKTQMRENNR